MKIEVNITKTHVFLIVGVLLILSGLIMVYAYNSQYNNAANNGVVLGHSADEVVVKMSDGSLATVEELLKDAVSNGGPSFSPAEIYFGGMYGKGINNGGVTFNINNPLAGNTYGCPTGYKSFEVRYADNILEGPTYLCAGFPGINSKIAEFGGMFMNYTGTMAVNQADGGGVNPITNKRTCPAGYSWAIAVDETAAYDGKRTYLTYCYNTNIASASKVSIFGGMWGMGIINGGNGPTTLYYSNPLTGGAGCFGYFNDTMVMGVGNVDYPTHVCFIKI